MTGWWHRTRIVIISRQFQNPVQPIFKSWRNRKRGTLYARTRKAPTWQAGNQRKRPDDHGKCPERNSFQKSATILIFYGRGFANRHFTETDSLYAPCPDCPDLCPYFYLRKPIQATCNLVQLTAGFHSKCCLCQAMPSYAKFAKNGFSVFKSQIRRKISDSQH